MKAQVRVWNAGRGVALFLVLSVMTFASTFAATNNWLGGSGDWQDKKNWSLNQRPDTDQDMVITNAGTFTVNVDDQTASSHPNPMTVLSLTLSNATGASTLLLTNRPSSASAITLTVLKDARIDTGGILKMADASATSVGVTFVASNLFNDSAISVQTNTSLVVTNVLRTPAKLNQIGSLTTAGGNVKARTVKLGEAAGSLGTWMILDGTNIVGETLHIGSDNGTGVVTQTGGKLIIGGSSSDYETSIGASPGSTGTVTLVNGQIAGNFNPFVIGEQGVGSLIVSNGSFAASRVRVGVSSGARGRYLIANGNNLVTTLDVGGSADALGEVMMTDGSLTSSSIYVGGPGGPGSLVISNGSISAGLIGISEYNNSAGTVTIAGGSTIADFVSLGGNGTGVLWLTGGELVVTGAWPNGRFDFRFGAESQLICSGGVLTVREMDLGFHASQQTWEIAGGTNIVQENADILRGLCKISGGRLEVGWLRVGLNSFFSELGYGQLVVSGGEVRANRLDVGADVGKTGIVEVAGGQLSITNGGSLTIVGFHGAGQLLVSSGTLNAATLWLGGPSGSVGTLTVQGGVANIGSLSFVQGDLFVGEGSGSTGNVSVTGGTLLARTVTVGDSGVGNLSISSNGNFSTLGIRVGNQAGSVGFASFEGGTLTGPAPREFYELAIGVSASSTGAVWIVNGALGVVGCPGATVGGSGSGLLATTNALLSLNSISVGGGGTLEFVNSQLVAFGCSVLNNNVMTFINCTSQINSPVQNPGTITVSGGTLTILGSVNNPGTIIATNSTVQFLGGINNSGNVVLGPDQFRVTSTTSTGNDVSIFWQAFGGNRYRVQASSVPTSGFSDVSPEITVVGNGMVITNYIDVGVLTNSSPQFYRVRQVW